MRAVVWVVALVVGLLAVPARADTFDVVTYTPPKGWTIKKDASLLTMQSINEKKKTFSLIIVQPSTASLGSLDKDFTATWDAQIVPGFKVTTAPEKTPPEKNNGWDVLSGVAQGDANGTPAGVILVVATGHGRTINMIVVTNTDEQQAALESFLTSATLDKAPKPLAKTDATATTTAPPPAPSKGGMTTKFDDGWTSRIDTDWVEVTKGAHRVRLHYTVEYTDESRRDTAKFFWNKLVAPRYTVKSVVFVPHHTIDFPYYFAHGEVTDNVTKQSGFVALRVHSAGTAYPIEVFSPSKDAFNKEFPDQDKLVAITGANRFALDKSVVGSWQNFSSSSLDMYYTNSGNYAGTDSVALSDQFVFDANGKFTSEHKGASSVNGRSTVFQQKHAGIYSVQTWELTTKTKTATTVYTGHFSAVRGGLVLNLTNKAATGIRYTLGRKK